MGSNHSFTVGRQPCADFKPQREANEHAVWDNRHECYKGCGLEVSFCETCHYDHHENGYDTCAPAAAARKENTP